MATYRLSPEQSTSYEQGGFAEIRVLEDAIEWAECLQPREPVVVLTCEGAVAFALTAAGGAYAIA